MNTTDSGLLEFTIGTNNVVTPRFMRFSLKNKRILLYINWYANFKDDIGIWSSPGNLGGHDVASLSYLESVPDLSTTKFMLVSYSNASIPNTLIASTNDFLTFNILNLAIPSNLDADIDRCGTNLSTGSVNVLNIVSLQDSWMIQTLSGVLTVRNDSQVD